MDPSELFSHPEQPEFVSSHDTSPAELPTFSDRPESKAAVAQTPSSWTAATVASAVADGCRRQW